MKKNNNPANKAFVKAEDIMEIMSVSRAMAYRIMKKLNDELEKKGYIVVSGRVSRAYLMERLGIPSTESA